MVSVVVQVFMSWIFKVLDLAIAYQIKVAIYGFHFRVNCHENNVTITNSSLTNGVECIVCHP